jgi:hypothetical protein
MRIGTRAEALFKVAQIVSGCLCLLALVEEQFVLFEEQFTNEVLRNAV